MKKIWNTQIDEHVICAESSSNSKYIAVGSSSGKIFVFDLQSGKTLREYSSHSVSCASLSWINDTDIFSSIGQDGKIRSWNIEDNSCISEIEAGDFWGTKVSWNSNGNLLVSLAGKYIKLISREFKILIEYPKQDFTVLDVCWLNGIRQFATSSNESVKLWSTENTKPIKEFLNSNASYVLKVSPNNKYIVTGDQDCTAHFWRIKDGKDSMMSGYTSKVKNLSWDKNSQYLASDGGSVAVVWDCSGKGPDDSDPILLEYKDSNITAIKFQHKGNVLVSGYESGEIAVWQPEISEGFIDSEIFNGEISVLEWSKNDQFLFAGTSEGQVCLLGGKI